MSTDHHPPTQHPHLRGSGPSGDGRLCAGAVSRSPRGAQEVPAAVVAQPGSGGRHRRPVRPTTRGSPSTRPCRIVTRTGYPMTETTPPPGAAPTAPTPPKPRHAAMRVPTPVGPVRSPNTCSDAHERLGSGWSRADERQRHAPAGAPARQREQRGGTRARARARDGASAQTDRRWLGIGLGLIVAFMLVEVVVGVVAQSLALISDAAHMLTDAASIALALVAIRLAARPARGHYTYGLKRTEILSRAEAAAPRGAAPADGPQGPGRDHQAQDPPVERRKTQSQAPRRGRRCLRPRARPETRHRCDGRREDRPAARSGARRQEQVGHRERCRRCGRGAAGGSSTKPSDATPPIPSNEQA